jgi:hypothetical protein
MISDDDGVSKQFVVWNFKKSLDKMSSWYSVHTLCQNWKYI